MTATQAIASKVLTQNVAATSFTPVTGSGGIAPRSYSIAPALPTGLSLNTSTGAITGTPTVTSGATTYTVTVTDANSATASNTFNLTVNGAVTATQGDRIGHADAESGRDDVYGRSQGGAVPARWPTASRLRCPPA